MEGEWFHLVRIDFEARIITGSERHMHNSLWGTFDRICTFSTLNREYRSMDKLLHNCMPNRSREMKTI